MIDWSPGWLRGATIAAARWIVDGVGGLTATERPAGEGRTAVALCGGLPGERYSVRGEVILSDGRRASRSLTLAIGGGR
jgi:hypothetical protein